MTSLTRSRHRWARRLTQVSAAAAAAFLLASTVGARLAVAGSHATFAVPANAISRNHREVRFPSRIDDVRLSGWLFRADHPTGRSVILVHGWQGNREDVDFVALTRKLLPRGYDVLMFDLRGSGLSMGSNQTLAHNEPRDLLGAYDYMLSLGYAPDQMTVLGNSMGAASVIEAAPKLTAVGALVADSAFANLSSAMQGGLTCYTKLPGCWPSLQSRSPGPSECSPRLARWTPSGACRVGRSSSSTPAGTLCWAFPTPISCSQRRQTAHPDWSSLPVTTTWIPTRTTLRST